MTTLYEVRSTIGQADEDDWNVILNGPTFLSAFQSEASSDSWRLDSYEHIYRASYIGDVRIGIAWGMRVGYRIDGDEQYYSPEWAAGFSDHSVIESYADVLWNNALIDRIKLAEVDGCRVTLPAPSQKGNSVPAWERDFARLIHHIEHGRDAGYNFDDYMKTAGIKIFG